MALHSICAWFSGPAPERDAVGADGRSQGSERGIRISVGEAGGHPLLFNEEALARQELYEALDDTKE